MRTEVHANLGNQLGTAYFTGIDSKDSPADEPMTPEEAIDFLSQPAGKIKHPVLQSTLYNPQLEERIL